MAIGRLSVGIGKKGKASPHAKYIAREGKYAKLMKDKEDLNYKGKEELEYRGHGNMPKWAEHNPNYFWQMADEHERKNGSTYREHVIALPRELYVNERHDLIKDWIAQEIGEKHAYQYAIHNPPALDGDEQPHAHIMFSERTIDGIERDPDQYFKRYNSKNPEKGGAKKANTPKMSAERKEELKAMRDRWEKICNAHLERGFHSERISMKSLKEQGIEREPLNLTMAQLKQPEIKEAYRELLAAKNDDFMAELDVWMEFYDDNLEDEIKHQLAQKHEAERQAQAQQEAKREAERQAQAQQEAKREAERQAQAQQEA
ncbi:MobA/MobL family protein, partial [Psychrobacter okhotskensis]|uniref:MobA/MobL family protein n=1 Tax=Psychrobacter okhotskensis TaxID=212403 RepID=UPI001565F6FA